MDRGHIDDVAVSCDLVCLERMAKGTWSLCVYRGEARATFVLTSGTPIRVAKMEDDLHLVDDTPDPHSLIAEGHE